MIGFELEDSQSVICFANKLKCDLTVSQISSLSQATQTKGLRTSKQLVDLQEKQNGFLYQIQSWREVQLVYTPHVASLCSQMWVPEPNVHSDAVPLETLPKNIPLYLPSSLLTSIHILPELHKVTQLERCLCEPQADNALAKVRHQRHIIQGLWQFKQLNVSGTGNKPNTQMIGLYMHFDNKTK
jgi:hypothetical protein